MNPTTIEEMSIIHIQYLGESPLLCRLVEQVVELSYLSITSLAAMNIQAF